MPGKVLLTDYAWPDLAIEHELLGAAGLELVVADEQDEATLARLAVPCDAIMTNWAKVYKPVIDAAPKLRHIARLGIGLDNIDVATATMRGILVTNIPDYCLIEVAEHTIAMLLAAARKVAFYHLETKAGRYDLGAGPMLRRIAGQTLGLVGLGNIGKQVADRAAALGLRVIATTRSQKTPPGIEHRPLDQLLVESDYVSLHCPLTDETRHLISDEQFARMKPTAWLINTARGGMIDNAALTRALAANRIAGACLDVQDPEPPDLSQAPWNDPRVIVTPHAAFFSKESVDELRTRVCRQVIDTLSGRRPPHIVNPEVIRG